MATLNLATLIKMSASMTHLEYVCCCLSASGKGYCGKGQCNSWQSACQECKLAKSALDPVRFMSSLDAALKNNITSTVLAKIKQLCREATPNRRLFGNDYHTNNWYSVYAICAIDALHEDPGLFLEYMPSRYFATLEAICVKYGCWKSLAKLHAAQNY